ncbi:MAG: hypothetical protein WD768_02280 [Phycisphaeraceae bacterium]
MPNVKIMSQREGTPRVGPPLTPSATPGQRVAMWIDLMRASDELLLAGLRRRIGPGGDVVAACRAWYEREMDERDARRLKEGVYPRYPKGRL